MSAAWFLGVALLTRASVFGDPNYTSDEAFYFWVGQRAHEGLLPYVDIWDRKGPGLFLVYYLIAGVSWSVLAYQLAALFAAVATAFLVAAISERLSGRAGALLAGTLYLVLLPLYGGGGGQSPVFYNLLMAIAALSIVDSRHELDPGRVGWRSYLAMAAAGFAITFKQSVVVEAAFFGGYSLWRLYRAGRDLPALARHFLGLALTGASPMLGFALAFEIAGHFTAFWDAMVTANIHRTYYSWQTQLTRAAVFAIYCGPALVPAIAGIPGKHLRSWPQDFLLGWIVAAIGGILIMPNFFDHYALPLMLPASVAAGRAVNLGRVRPAILALGIVLILALGPAFKFADRHRSREAIATIVEQIQRRGPHPRLLVYEGPVSLYRLLGATPLSPLQFPMHLYYPYEDNAGPFNTAAEMHRILDRKPNVIVRYAHFPDAEENQATAAPLRAYLQSCRFWFRQRIYEVSITRDVDVYGDCGQVGLTR